MNWLSAHITREGPGVPRNAPPKRGLALLADVIRREWWMLLQLNLLYIVFALPVVTLPAAQVAASRICAAMLEDRNVYLLRDFWETFRDRFVRATLAGAVGAATLAASGYAAWTFVQAARDNILFVFPFVVCLTFGVFATITTMYGLTLLAMRDLRPWPLLRLAMLGALARPLPALGALAAIAVLWLVHVALYPASIFMPAVLNFSFGTLAATFGVHQAATRLLAPDSGAAQAGAGAGGNAPVRVQ